MKTKKQSKGEAVVAVSAKATTEPPWAPSGVYEALAAFVLKGRDMGGSLEVALEQLALDLDGAERELIRCAEKAASVYKRIATCARMGAVYTTNPLAYSVTTDVPALVGRVNTQRALFWELAQGLNLERKRAAYELLREAQRCTEESASVTEGAGPMTLLERVVRMIEAGFVVEAALVVLDVAGPREVDWGPYVERIARSRGLDANKLYERVVALAHDCEEGEEG